MEKVNINELTADKAYDYLVHSSTVEELVEKHKLLSRRLFFNDEGKEVFPCRWQINGILSRDYYRTIPVMFSKLEIDFINSDYVSDYFKERILDSTYREEHNRISLSCLQGSLKEYAFNDLNAFEIKNIVKLMDDSYNTSNSEWNNQLRDLQTSFMHYLFKLQGEGPKEYLDKYLGSKKLCENILLRSGLSSEGGFYSGKGVDRDDINGTHLISIYEKLVSLNQTYGDEFVKMLHMMDVITATMFINNFYIFGENGFKTEGLVVTSEGLMALGITQEQLAYGAAQILTNTNKRDYDTEVWQSGIFKHELEEYIERKQKEAQRKRTQFEQDI